VIVGSVMDELRRTDTLLWVALLPLAALGWLCGILLKLLRLDQ
jgi:hypothetical protein